MNRGQDAISRSLANPCPSLPPVSIHIYPRAQVTWVSSGFALYESIHVAFRSHFREFHTLNSKRLLCAACMYSISCVGALRLFHRYASSMLMAQSYFLLMQSSAFGFRFLYFNCHPTSYTTSMLQTFRKARCQELQRMEPSLIYKDQLCASADVGFFTRHWTHFLRVRRSAMEGFSSHASIHTSIRPPFNPP